jgi:hypothetical protein
MDPALNDPDDLPDFGAHVKCRFFPCRGCVDVTALLGINEDLCRQVEELQNDLEAARERLAQLDRVRR